MKLLRYFVCLFRGKAPASAVAKTTGTPDDLREAFYELSMAQPMRDAEALDALIRLYPQHAEALTAFATDLTVDALAHGDD